MKGEEERQRGRGTVARRTERENTWVACYLTHNYKFVCSARTLSIVHKTGLEKRALLYNFSTVQND
jgi:hypothetical protein